MRRVICAALGAVVLAGAPAPALAAGNGQLVATDGSRLVTLNPDGSAPRALYAPGSGHWLRSPSWSPDGNAIAFSDSGRIAVFDLLTGQASTLTTGPEDGSPAWSPDGARIAFARGDEVHTVRRDGSDEQPLLDLQDGGVIGGLAWSGDGKALALVTRSQLLRVALDDDDVEVVAPLDVSGGPAFSPDGTKLAYASTLEGTEVRVSTLGVQSTGGPNRDPAFSPDGTRLVFVNSAIGSRPVLRTMTVGDPGSQADLPRQWDVGLSQPDWQPCVAGVTLSCTSPGWHCPDATATAVAGQYVQIAVACPGADRLELVEMPAHGIAGASVGRISFRPVTTFAGTEVIRFRGRHLRDVSEVATVTVAVAPKPAAPTLTALKVPRLASSVRLRATCDRACTVSLRVSVRLNTGRVVKGKLVRRSAPAGGTMTLRLARGKLPPRRRVAKARIVGTVKGPDGLSRAFSLTLKR